MNSASLLYIHSDTLAMKVERAGRVEDTCWLMQKEWFKPDPFLTMYMTVGQLQEAPSKHTY
jgi:hypothetical protein